MKQIWDWTLPKVQVTQLECRIISNLVLNELMPFQKDLMQNLGVLLEFFTPSGKTDESCGWERFCPTTTGVPNVIILGRHWQQQFMPLSPCVQTALMCFTWDCALKSLRNFSYINAECSYPSTNCDYMTAPYNKICLVACWFLGAVQGSSNDL